MSELPFISFLGQEITVYSLLACALGAVCFGLYLGAWNRTGRPAGAAWFFGLLAALLALLLGRGVYCAVRHNAMFFDGMGDYRGLWPFFFLNEGSVSVVGVLAGFLLAGLLAGKLTGVGAAPLLDAAALPGLLLFALMRFIEPLSGQGYGPLVESRLLCWPPLSIDSGWGDWSLSVCFIEGLLALAALAAVWKLPHRKAGTRALLALALLCATQIIPEIPRQDNVLLMFIFAPVTQMGYAVLLFGCLLAALRSFPRKTRVLEAGLLLLGIALVGGGEFALDKSEWSHALLYAGMIAVMAAMLALVLRRILAADGAAQRCGA